MIIGLNDMIANVRMTYSLKTRVYLILLLIWPVFMMSCNISESRRNRFYVRANELLELKDYRNALKSYDEALKIDPAFASGWNNKGIAHFELGEYAEAVE